MTASLDSIGTFGSLSKNVQIEMSYYFGRFSGHFLIWRLKKDK